ncbi:MAG: response regulator, partial [Rhodocyclaceae bacterium]|nr:response regulator [Rhodocyclaceae bacterium]
MKKTVLVVEDNDNNLYLVTFLLEKRNLEVIAARDGPTGIAMAQQHMPALILLDIQLPGMDGYAVAQALRAIPALNPVPIVAVSSYAMCGDR